MRYPGDVMKRLFLSIAAFSAISCAAMAQVPNFGGNGVPNAAPGGASPAGATGTYQTNGGSGTLAAGNISASGTTDTESGSILFTGAAATVGAGQGSIGGSSTGGAMIQGNGSVNDVTLANRTGAIACGVPPSSTGFTCNGALATGLRLTVFSTQAASGNAFYQSATNTPAIAANGTLTASFPPTGVNLLGATSNTNAAAGFVGEYTSSIVLAGSAVALASNGAALDITTLTLSAGDWDVSGVCATQPAGSAISTAFVCNVTTTANTLNNIPSDGGAFAFNNSAQVANAGESLTTDTARISITASTTYHLVASTTYLTGTGQTVGGYGKIRARRVR